jgi:hypothetical protein
LHAIINSNYRIAATLCSLGTGFANTLHSAGGCDDNDDGDYSNRLRISNFVPQTNF